jgi:hypothetical protein
MRSPTSRPATRCRSARFREIADPLVPRRVADFLAEVAPPLARALWDEIAEIGRDPLGRGSPYEGMDDPEFADLRSDWGSPDGRSSICLCLSPWEPM